MRTIVTSLGLVAGKFIGAYGQTESEKRIDFAKGNLMKKIAFGFSVPETTKILSGFLFDWAAEKLIGNCAVDEFEKDFLDSSKREKLLFYTLTNAVDTAGAFANFSDKENCNRTFKQRFKFGPGGSRYWDEKDGWAGDEIKCRSGRTFDLTSRNKAFSLRMLLMAIKEGQYKDFVDEKSPVMPVLSQVESVVKWADLDNGTFTNLDGTTTVGRVGQNKLITGAVCKLIGKSVDGRFFEKTGKKAKFNSLIKSLVSAWLRYPQQKL